MTTLHPLISTGALSRQTLAGRVAVVTGGGRGIGFETARSLIWLGARVVIAEIDKQTGKEAAQRLTDEFGAGLVSFVQTDVGDEGSVNSLVRQAVRNQGQVDIVLNNATVTPLGAVKDVPIKDWDASYRVNLRGPVLLARAFLPGMLERNYGVFACVSSVGDAYMGAYESLKAAQVHLANTLDAELAGMGVSAFTIGPGMVPTPGIAAAIEKIAGLYGKSVEEFWAMSKEHILSVEAAGAGFAAAVALAERFRGQEISSKQALIAAGIDWEPAGQASDRPGLTDEQWTEALELCRRVRATLAEQTEGWKQRPLFERQWVIRDFGKNAGTPAEQWLELLGRLEATLAGRDQSALAALHVPAEKLAGYYRHLEELARGYEKNPATLAEHVKIMRGWQEDAGRLGELLGT